MLPASVRLVERAGALPRLDVVTRASAAQVYYQGAHVARWQPAPADAPVLFLSAHTDLREGKAIRGGVPICFPWFATHGTDRGAPSHGFVRTAAWALTDGSEADDGTVALRFVLDVDEHASPLWPHRARLAHRISIGTTLEMALDVENRGAESMTFEEALHTYFSVGDIERVAIAGLEDTEYLDKVEGWARRRQGREPIRFAGETDRVYLDTTATCRIADEERSREIVVEKSGSHSTVVWNPWADRARALPDLGADDWRQMVCVETANVGAAAVTLAPGASHTMRAALSVAAR